MSLKARPAFFKMPRQAIARACRGFWIYLTRRNGTWSAIQEFLFKGIPSTATTIDHATWQYCLLNQRLRLVLWVYLLCLISVVSLDLYRLQFLTIQLDRWDFLVEAAIALGLVGCLILQRTSFGQRHPEWLFLGASWSVTMVLQLSHTLRGYADEDLHAWNLVFLTQAIFIPMRWRLHLTSQLLPLAYFFTVNPLLGLELKPPVEMPLSTIIPDVALLAFWMCFICDLGVFMYDRLQRAEFEARQELRVFLHAVSHDLRNPVAGMLLVLGNLLSPRASKLSTQSEPSDIVPVPRRVLEQIVQSGDRQLNLLESLLEAHQNEMKGMVLHCKPLVLHTFVPCAIAELQPILAEHQATSELRIATTLPPVHADPTQLWRVFQNLLTNALKHNLPGLHVTLGAELLPGAELRNLPLPCDRPESLSANLNTSYVRCYVRDNGIGMEPKQCELLFDLYAQGANRRQRLSLGLGLYLCRQIITAHGGSIGATSQPGQGLTVWFTLPAIAS